MTEVNNLKDYRENVLNAVDVIAEEYENYDSELSELVWETVDNDQLIIYFSHNLSVLQHSDKQPEEWKHFVSEDSSWQEVLQALAFDVYRQDVWEEVEKRDLE